MKKQIFLIFLICIVLLTWCSKEQTFEDFFHAAMGKMHKGEKDYSYSLIHKEMNVVHEEDAIAVFKENNIQGEQVFIAYFEKENGDWKWRRTRGAEWNTPHKWSSLNQVPYIYSGAISEESISEVYAGEELAKIIEVEGNKRFWYAISDVKDVEVKIVKENGVQQTIQEIDFELMEY